jgi:hypothetical protein
MVKRQRLALAILGGLLLLAAVWALLPSSQVTTAGPVDREGAAPGPDALPRIGLDRVQRRASRPDVGQRDLFGFGEPPAPPAPPPEVRMPVPSPLPVTVPTPPPPPPLNVKYIGSMEQKGLKVALFMNEQKEVLSGQVGQTVMNRFRVVRIGFESVDVEDVGSGQVRRIPLRGN